MKIVLIDSGMGVVPFIREILFQEKRNTYILLLKEDAFPLGNKSQEDLQHIYREMLQKAAAFHPDLVFIACNTLSTMITEEFYPFPILSVLQYNLLHREKNVTIVATLATTNYLRSRGEKNVLAIPSLANDIEQGNFYNIIHTIKEISFPEKILLACTHYPLVKFLFKKYGKCDVFSFEKEIIQNFSSAEEKMTIHFYTKRKEIYQKFFSSEDIFFSEPS